MVPIGYMVPKMGCTFKVATGYLHGTYIGNHVTLQLFLHATYMVPTEFVWVTYVCTIFVVRYYVFHGTYHM